MRKYADLCGMLRLNSMTTESKLWFLTPIGASAQRTNGFLAGFVVQMQNTCRRNVMTFEQ